MVMGFCNQENFLARLEREMNIAVISDLCVIKVNKRFVFVVTITTNCFWPLSRSTIFKRTSRVDANNGGQKDVATYNSNLDGCCIYNFQFSYYENNNLLSARVRLKNQTKVLLFLNKQMRYLLFIDGGRFISA